MSKHSYALLASSGDHAVARRSAVSPRKSPVQVRSGQTVEAILAAAARVLTRDGAAGFTTNKVAEKAGVSIGSLYQYFPNKESIVSELARRHLADLERGINDITTQAREAPLEAVVRALIEDNVRAHLIDPKLHGVLTEQVQQLGRFRWQEEFGARVSARVRALLEARKAELAVNDLDLATFILTQAVEACVHDGVTARPADMASGALARDLTRMILLYLTGKTK
jgi:AcrR family transcriptional regulator